MGFLMTPKYVTLNDLEMPFCAKICFLRRLWLDFFEWF